MFIRSQPFSAALAVALLPCALAGAQAAPAGAAQVQSLAPGNAENGAGGEANAQGAALSTAPDFIVERRAPRPTPAEATAAPAVALPQAPSALLEQGHGARPVGLLHPGAAPPAEYVAASFVNGPGNSRVELPTQTPLELSLDDAIALGLKRNVRLRYERANQQYVRGYTGDIVNSIIPNLQFRAASSAQEINLIGLGFKPALVGPLLSKFGLSASSFPTIVKVSTTSVQVSVDQTLFNVPDYELLKAIRPEEASVAATVSDAGEQVVQAIATAYLQVLADQANLVNSEAQEDAARALYNQARQLDEAGVGVKLDVLRAQVTYQQRQQEHVSADAQLDKDGIQLNRIMGLPACQPLDLIDSAPFADLADISIDEARQMAFAHRSDLRSIDTSIEVSTREARAVRYQRLPTLGFSGFYGILGLDTGPYHGVFTASGSLRFPIFREAAQRGEEQTANAQLQTLEAQENNLRGTIEMQVRDALLDVNAAQKLVTVAQSSAALARQELADARDRFSAGVSDNLEVVDAQADVTNADAQLVDALFQYNTAKVNLARSMGILQSQYRAFLGS